MRRAVFLDRDGVLNPMVDRDGRLRAPLRLCAFTPYAWSGDAVRRLHAGGYLCIVVTNQPEVATGELAPTVLEAMHERLRQETGVDAVYVCPHRDEDRCACRKPRPGLLLRAARELAVDLGGSFLVGDRRRDIEAGQAAGCTTVLVGESDEAGGPFHHRAADLAAAADIILDSGKGGT